MQTAELTGAALNWAVAKCENQCGNLYNEGFLLAHIAGNWNYSTNWAQGGQIIERECIQLMPDAGATYTECFWFAGSANENGDEFNGEGSTPLIAAMRCYVASKLGDDVEIPEYLA